MESPLYPGNVMINLQPKAFIMSDRYKQTNNCETGWQILPHGPIWDVMEAQKRGVEQPWEVREDFLKNELSLETLGGVEEACPRQRGCEHVQTYGEEKEPCEFGELQVVGCHYSIAWTKNVLTDETGERSRSQIMERLNIPFLGVRAWCQS